MDRLEGKVAFVTGAGGGIGRSMCERFVAEGAKVAVVDISDDLADSTEEAANQHQKGSGEAFAVHCDVTAMQSIQAAISKTVGRFGKLDILCNVAGGSTAQDGMVTKAPEDEFWRAITLDLFGTFLCCKVGIPELIKAGGGSVINMSSMAALMALPGRDCYTAAKGGVAAITRSMAVEYAPQKVRVNAIAPSVTLSDRVKVLLSHSEDLQKLSASHLLGLGEPIDIAHMAVYLASEEARIVTGQIYSVDSGVTIC